MKFQPGQTVKSVNTGMRVRVTGEGRHPDTFAGEYIGIAKQFCYHWHDWKESSFVPVEESA